MRLLVALALIGSCLALPAAATQVDPRLDGLFADLKAAPDAEAAAPIEQRIWTIWGQSEDDDSRRLMQAGEALIGEQKLDQAIGDLSRLIAHDPDFAEAWNRRATANYLKGDLTASVSDIEKVLELEPRHFGALSGLGLIYMRLGQEEAALKSFEAALKVHPYLPTARAHVDMLRDQVLGKPL